MLMPVDDKPPSRPPTRASQATADTETWEDGSFHGTVAPEPNSGGGAATMQRFMREHMQCILAPIGEHVAELEARVRSMQQELGRVDAKVDRSHSRLAEHDEEIGVLQHGAEDMLADQGAMRKEMSRMAEEQGVLQTDRDSQREGLAKLEDRLDSTRDSMLALREAAEDTDASLQKLQLKQWETANLLGRAQGGVDEMKAARTALEQNHAAHARGHQSTADELRRDVEALRTVLEEQSKASAEAIAELERWREEAKQPMSLVASHEEELKEFRALLVDGRATPESEEEEAVQGGEKPEAKAAQPPSGVAPVSQPSQGSALQESQRAAPPAVVQVQQEVVQHTAPPMVQQGAPEVVQHAAPKVVQHAEPEMMRHRPSEVSMTPMMSTRRSSGLSDLGALNKRLSQVEDSVQQVSNEVARVLSAGLSTRVDQMDLKINRAAADCEKHGQTLRSMDEAVSSCRDKITKLESRSAGLESKSDRLEERTGLLESHVDSLEHKEREDRRAIEDQQGLLEEAEDKHMHLESTVTGALQDLKGLTADLGKTKETVSEQKALLDLAHEFIQGVGRGFQDTHRQVLTGTNGLLPPMSARERTPAALPKPRPMSAGRRVRVPQD